MQEAILQCVVASGGATFARLCRDVPGFAGNMELSSSGASNLIYWHGVSAEAIEALRGLQREKKVHLQPASWAEYYRDGAVLGFPLVEPLASENPPEPRWFMVRVCEGPGKVR